LVAIFYLKSKKSAGEKLAGSSVAVGE
jgi:hypothetical protein